VFRAFDVAHSRRPGRSASTPRRRAHHELVFSVMHDEALSFRMTRTGLRCMSEDGDNYHANFH
jgi:hypothetical protein